MTKEPQPISILSETECWDLLSSIALGRLVTSVDGQQEIYPVNFVVQRRTVLFRTAEGTTTVLTGRYADETADRCHSPGTPLSLCALRSSRLGRV